MTESPQPGADLADVRITRRDFLRELLQRRNAWRRVNVGEPGAESVPLPQQRIAGEFADGQHAYQVRFHVLRDRLGAVFAGEPLEPAGDCRSQRLRQLSQFVVIPRHREQSSEKWAMAAGLEAGLF